MSSPETAAWRSARTVLAGDTRFLLREQGSGEGVPVLLLHGVPETSSAWCELAPVLADGRRVLAPDLPGLGGSAYDGPYDVDALAAQLAALLQEEVDGPVDVVGHDWGGVLALALAERQPGRIRRVCVANAPYRTLPLTRALHVPFLALPVLPEVLFRAAGRQIVDAAFLLLWRSARPVPAELLAEYQAAYSEPACVRSMLGYYRAAVRPRLRPHLPPRRTPAGRPQVRVEAALVLWGAADPVLPVRTGEDVVRDLGAVAVMVTVPRAGHFVMEEEPEVVADVLTQFLDVEPPPLYAPGRTAPA